jgi:hypothetical protein
MNDVQRTCGRLISHGARKGPEIIRFNAQLRGAWLPGGSAPLSPRPANDPSPSMGDSIA